MHQSLVQRSARPVALWLLAGVVMLMVQVLLGGITRLTGSGLSITEWKPVMGFIPPLNDQEWHLAFEKYQQIAQYKYVNTHFTLPDFKFIYFWEWFHRLWARLIAVAFLIPFFIFLVQKRFRKDMIKPMLALFLLGILQGLIGWIMVQSGLEDSELLYVSHLKLAVHFILALTLIGYTLWFALDLLVPAKQIIHNRPFRNFTIWLMVLLIIQLIYGAFMAGLKAAPAAATWPSINGAWVPADIFSYGEKRFSFFSSLTSHPLVVHFIHRNLATLSTCMIFFWWFRSRRLPGTTLFKGIRILPPVLVLLQVVLGILVLMHAANSRSFLWIAQLHQLNAMLLFLSVVVVLYTVRGANHTGSFDSAVRIQ